MKLVLTILWPILLMILNGQMEPRWGILSVFPRPMPIHHDAGLFPRLFTSNRSLDIPYLPIETDLAPIGENRSFGLKGTLCFYIVRNISETSSCIPLYNQMAGWFDLPLSSSGPCHSANATWASG